MAVQMQHITNRDPRSRAAECGSDATQLLIKAGEFAEEAGDEVARDQFRAAARLSRGATGSLVEEER